MHSGGRGSQGWKLNAAVSSTATTAPRVIADRTASRTPGYLWTTKAHLLRQPGYLREARGFASPPRDGFAIYRSVPAGEALTDGTNVRRAVSPAREA